jgi:hypothetical protein
MVSITNKNKCEKIKNRKCSRKLKKAHENEGITLKLLQRLNTICMKMKLQGFRNLKV